MPHPAQAAVTQAWVQRYNGPANSGYYAPSLAVDGHGNVVAKESSDGDSYTAKYGVDLGGNQLTSLILPAGLTSLTNLVLNVNQLTSLTLPAT